MNKLINVHFSSKLITIMDIPVPAFIHRKYKEALDAFDLLCNRVLRGEVANMPDIQR